MAAAPQVLVEYGGDGELGSRNINKTTKPMMRFSTGNGDWIDRIISPLIVIDHQTAMGCVVVPRWPISLRGFGISCGRLGLESACASRPKLALFGHVAMSE